MRNTKRIVVALRMAGIAGQDKLNGVFEYLSEGNRWTLSIYRLASEFTADAVQLEIEKGADGFIVGLPDVQDALKKLESSNLPVVLINLPSTALASRKSKVLRIHTNSSEIGKVAAQTLITQGFFKSFAYVGYKTDEAWSRERGEAFAAQLQELKLPCAMFDINHVGEKINDHQALKNWLITLPKPCGILASCDDTAFEVLNACRECNINLPYEIGILGVNNDPILCENSEPRLSSVQPDFKREGFLAAKALKHPPSLTTLEVGVRQVVHRETTLPISRSGKLVQKAIAYIEANVFKKISCVDVAKHLGVSRALLDLRFREYQKVSVKKVIAKARLNAIKRRLLASREPIELLAERCGWANSNSLKNHFKREMGMSMRQWRNLAFTELDDENGRTTIPLAKEDVNSIDL